MHPSTVDPTAPPLDRTLSAVVVHTALRRELRLAGPLVRAVADGDAARARTVARHLDLVLRMLHHHHHTEDAFVWPILRARAAEEVQPLIDLMEAQHGVVEHALERLDGLVPAWAAGADAAVGATLAEVLDGLHVDLDEHLAAEERDVFPIAERVLTEPEWEALAREGEKGAAGREKAFVFGVLQHEGDPAVLADMLSAAPWPVRVLVPRLARRAYRRHALVVHGTAMP